LVLKKKSFLEFNLFALALIFDHEQAVFSALWFCTHHGSVRRPPKFPNFFDIYCMGTVVVVVADGMFSSVVLTFGDLLGLDVKPTVLPEGVSLLKFVA